LIDYHDFRVIDGTVRHTLSGEFTPFYTGLYSLHISNTCVNPSSTSLYSYIDNISILPKKTNFFVSPMNFSCETGGMAYFKLDAGSAHARKKYWIWISASGTYPGFVVSGITVPLKVISPVAKHMDDFDNAPALQLAQTGADG